MLDAAIFDAATSMAAPVAASFLTTRYWTARVDGDPRRHAWFALYLGVVLALLVGVVAATPPEDRLRSVALFFGVTIVATLVQERRARRARRIADADRDGEE